MTEAGWVFKDQKQEREVAMDDRKMTTTTNQPSATMQTVRDATCQLLREFGMTTFFGNVGSTEETFLRNFPSDFRYVLGLQEASVIAMADGFAQATALTDLLGERKPRTGKTREKIAHRMAPHPPSRAKESGDGLLTAAQVFDVLGEIRPANAILVEESPSNLADLHKSWPITEPASFFTFASGGLGWNMPASVGIALGEREMGRNRPVIMIIGDGSFQYSLQSIWTGAQLRLPILIVVLRNDEYCILKSFAKLEETPGVPGLDLPDIDIVSLAKGYGCDAARLDDLDSIKKAAVEAWTKSKPTVLEIPISPQVPSLL